jgi:hypothetical protein
VCSDGTKWRDGGFRFHPRLRSAPRKTTNGESFNASVVLVDRRTGIVLHTYPLSAAQVGTHQPQIFQLAASYILLYLERAVMKVALPSGAVAWTGQFIAEVNFITAKSARPVLV